MAKRGRDMADTRPGNGQNAAARRGRRPFIGAAVILFVLASLIAWMQPPSPRIAERGALDWLLYPVESNPADRLPTIGQTPLSAASSSDSQRITVVGFDGTILVSDNAGESWKERKGVTKETLNGVSQRGDGSQIIAVGERGTILTSSNAGQSWLTRVSGTTIILHAVSQSADGQLVTAVGDNGTILSSNNTGQSWSTRVSGATDILNGVSQSADGQLVTAVGENGTILTSSDKGQSWASRASGTTNMLFAVSQSADGQLVTAVGENGTILTSNNAGISWNMRATNVNESLFAVSQSANGRRVVAGGTSGTVVTSDNAGQSWINYDSETTTFNFQSIICTTQSDDGQNSMIIGDNGTVWTSNDGGQTWMPKTMSIRVSLRSISHAGDGSNVAIVGDSGIILTSSDAGQNWITRNSGTTYDLRAVSQSENGDQIAAFGDQDRFLTSATGGTVWASQKSGTANWVTAVSQSTDGLSIVTVGLRGEIRTTENGGKTWFLRNSGTTKSLASVSKSERAGNVIAVGEGGEILTSNNAGKNWTIINSGTTNYLNGVSQSENGQQATVVGDGGIILISKNFGKDWSLVKSPTDKDLNAVSQSKTGSGVVAVGYGGTIVTSSNAGIDWTEINSGTSQRLNFVSRHIDDNQIVAVGDSRTILRSIDAGESWRISTVAKTNHRSPAAWYFLALILCAWLLYRGFTTTPAGPQSGAAAIAASDAPVDSPDQDRLDFAPLARGISRFLRNEDTHPPLTLAITGEWGSGKSSLMGQVCHDLRTHSWNPVWFNAWHHQNEEQLLAALLVAVRASGVPDLLSLPSFSFRLRLLLNRVQKHKVVTLAVITLISLMIALIVRHPNGADWQGLANLLKKITPGKETVNATALSYLPYVGALAALTPVLRGLKAFGVNPAALLSSTMAKFRLKDAAAQTSFRMRFGEQFGEVTAALAHPMVIVIDDLDRCKPETVLDVMEAVNFLTSSGRCYIIFGMATKRVQAALALSFRDIAAELVLFDAKSTPGSKAKGSDLDVEADQRQRRQDYARDYLEKLINIEVLVPDRSDLPPANLLEQRETPQQGVLDDILATLRRYVFLVPVGLVIAASVWLSGFIALPKAEPTSDTAPATEMAAQPKKPTVIKEPERQPQVAAQPQPNEPPAFIPGDNSPISFVWFLASLGLLALLTAFLFARWLRLQSVVVSDTAAFRDAMRIWTPVAAFERNSPRSIKRFGNRIRYLAMLQQGEQLDEKPGWARAFDVIRAQFEGVMARLRRRSDTPAEEAAPQAEVDEKERALALSEHRIVALGAIHAYFGNDWRSQAVKPSLYNDNRLVQELLSEVPGIDPLLTRAVTAYRKMTSAAWPPSNDELDAFERSLKGVRLPGDGRTYDDRSPATPQPESNADADEILKSRLEEPRQTVSQVGDSFEEFGRDLKEKADRSTIPNAPSSRKAPSRAKPKK